MARILVDRTPRPDFSDLVPPGEPTYAIAWRGDAGLSGCGCGCGECQGPAGGCGCGERLGWDHLDVVASGWERVADRSWNALPSAQFRSAREALPSGCLDADHGRGCSGTEQAVGLQPSLSVELDCSRSRVRPSEAVHEVLQSAAKRIDGRIVHRVPGGVPAAGSGASWPFLAATEESPRVWTGPRFGDDRVDLTQNRFGFDFFDCPIDYWDCGEPPRLQTPESPVTLDEVDAAADDLWSTGFGFLVLLDQNAVDLLSLALAFLRSNLDLVEYACCVVFGPEPRLAEPPGRAFGGQNVCECLVALIGGPLVVNYPLGPGPQGGFMQEGAALQPGPGCAVNIFSGWFEGDLKDFAVGSASDRLEMVLWNCTRIAEEMLHCCGPGHEAELGFCDPVNLWQKVLFELLNDRYR